MVSDEVRRAPNYDYFRARLREPWLLARAVVVEVDGEVIDLAVPVGGHRLAGYVVVDDFPSARCVLHQLARHDGFPHLVASGDHWDVPCHVAWGKPEPSVPRDDASEFEHMMGEVRAGRLYGYADAAIRAFLRGAYARAPQSWLSTLWQLVRIEQERP